ncbi:MAG: hypothetical protein M3N53_06485 [Actinomycetota bacterium]|nr:hypothetical protein [Actinomycetota bacterium]
MTRESGGGFFDGLARFVVSLLGLAGNSFGESRSVREEIAKQQELEREEAAPQRNES